MPGTVPDGTEKVPSRTHSEIMPLCPRFVLLNPNSESRNLAPKLPPRVDAVRGLEQEPVEEVPARRGSRD